MSVTIIPAGSSVVGIMHPSAGGNVDLGQYFICNGRLLNRVTYSALFAVIGELYGAGDGATTFAIPDMRGRFATRLDEASVGLPLNYETGYPNAEAWVATTPNHGHGHSGSSSTANGHIHNIPGDDDGGTGAAIEGSSSGGAGNRTLQSAGGHSHPNVNTASAPGHNHTVTVNGGGDVETRPINIALHYVIRVS